MYTIIGNYEAGFRASYQVNTKGKHTRLFLANLLTFLLYNYFLDLSFTDRPIDTIALYRGQNEEPKIRGRTITSQTFKFYRYHNTYYDL